MCQQVQILSIFENSFCKLENPKKILQKINFRHLSGLPVRRLRTHAAAITCVKFNEDSSVAISGSRDNTIQCFDIRNRIQEPIQTLKEAKDCITSVIVNEHKIISSSLDGCIRHYDLRAGQMTCDKIGIPVICLTQTSDEQCLLSKLINSQYLTYF